MGQRHEELDYLIAYLQEEQTRHQADWYDEPCEIRVMVQDALNAYQGGAR